MKFAIDTPQQSDMGSGFGHIEGCNGKSLKDVLNWIKETTLSWGELTIYKDKQIIRCFDYDLYSKAKQFYHNLSGWDYDTPVKEVKFEYCFMNKDIDIYM